MLLAAHLKNKNSTNMQPRDKKHFSYVSERQPGSIFMCLQWPPLIHYSCASRV